jgi:hypothetical protein
MMQSKHVERRLWPMFADYTGIGHNVTSRRTSGTMQVVGRPNELSLHTLRIAKKSEAS